jgi:hypothetical protein
MEARKKSPKTLKKVDWKLALEDAERELFRAESHADQLRKSIPILRQRVQDLQPSTHN